MGINASVIIKNKLIKNGGTATVYSIRGNPYIIKITPSSKTFETKALPSFNYEFTVFDVIIDLLLRNGGKASKGNGRSARLGEPNCEVETVVGAIGKYYAGKSEGDSVFDPVHVLAAILEWANICKNEIGYIELVPTYKV